MKDKPISPSEITDILFENLVDSPHFFKGMGDYALKEKDYEKAILCYRQAINQGLDGFYPYLKISKGFAQ